MKQAFLIFLALIAAGLALATAQNPQRYVRPSDQVAVNCDEEQAISKQYAVSNDGFIVMPYVGAVQIAGLTEEQAATKIGQDLVNEKILSKATVSVDVVSSMQGVVSFSGSVQNPGNAPPSPGMRVSDVVKLAQPTNQADMQRVRIVTAAGHAFVVNFAAFNGVNMVNNPQVLSGDCVFFDAIAAAPVIQATPMPNSPMPPVYHPANPVAQSSQGGQPSAFVRVLGAVATPQNVPYQPGMSLSLAINDAGGLLKDSDSANVAIHRRVDGRPHVFKANLNDINRGFAGDIALQPGDAVEVPQKRHGGGIGKTLKVAGLVLLGIIVLH